MYSNVFPKILEGEYNEEGDMDRFERRRSSRKKPRERTVDEWRQIFTKDDGKLMQMRTLKAYWDRANDGPPPGAQGCQVPAAVLYELGFETNVRELSQDTG